MVGVFDCIEGASEGYDEADFWGMSSDAALPSCSGNEQRRSGQDNANALQDTNVYLDDAQPTPARGSAVNGTDQDRLLEVSSLTPENQLLVRQSVRAHYMELLNNTLPMAFEASRSGNEAGDAMLWASFEQAGLAFIASMDEALAEDFMVRLT
ncbi:MAG: hypothetical protein ABR586_05250 [Thermoplasmatota archaeon]